MVVVARDGYRVLGQAAAAAATSSIPAVSTGADIDTDELVDETGVDSKDIELIMSQVRLCVWCISVYPLCVCVCFFFQLGDLTFFYASLRNGTPGTILYVSKVGVTVGCWICCLHIRLFIFC